MNKKVKRDFFNKRNKMFKQKSGSSCDNFCKMTIVLKSQRKINFLINQPNTAEILELQLVKDVNFLAKKKNKN